MTTFSFQSTTIWDTHTHVYVFFSLNVRITHLKWNHNWIWDRVLPETAPFSFDTGVSDTTYLSKWLSRNSVKIWLIRRASPDHNRHNRVFGSLPPGGLRMLRERLYQTEMLESFWFVVTATEQQKNDNHRKTIVLVVAYATVYSAMFVGSKRQHILTT